MGVYEAEKPMIPKELIWPALMIMSSTNAFKPYTLSQNELILYDNGQDRPYVLNTTGMIVWEMCDGSHTVKSMAEEIAQCAGCNQDEVLAHVFDLVGALRKAGLLMPEEGEQAPPAAEPQKEEMDAFEAAWQHLEKTSTNFG